MRIGIYSVHGCAAVALALASEATARGHKAVMRSSNDFDASQVEPFDRVVVIGGCKAGVLEQAYGGHVPFMHAVTGAAVEDLLHVFDEPAVVEPEPPPPAPVIEPLPEAEDVIEIKPLPVETTLTGKPRRHK